MLFNTGAAQTATEASLFDIVNRGSTALSETSVPGPM